MDYKKSYLKRDRIFYFVAGLGLGHELLIRYAHKYSRPRLAQRPAAGFARLRLSRPITPNNRTQSFIQKCTKDFVCWPPRSRKLSHQAPQGFFEENFQLISTLLGMGQKRQMRHYLDHGILKIDFQS